MPTVPAPFRRLLQDPAPEFVFEISPDSIRMARTANPSVIEIEPLAPGIIVPSPLHDNVALSEPLNEAVARLAPPNPRGNRRTAALLLPDHCAHVAVLDFDSFPDKQDEQLALIRFRLKRNVPFDLESAALSYCVQNAAAHSAKGRREVVVAVTALEIVSRYEAPFRAAGIQPGMVSLSPLACLDLVDTPGIVAIARLSGSVLSIFVQRDAVLKVARSIVLAEVTLPEIASHLHQTFAFVEDNLNAPALELLLAGFGMLEHQALRDFPAELSLDVRVLGGSDTGIRGYLKGLAA